MKTKILAMACAVMLAVLTMGSTVFCPPPTPTPTNTSTPMPPTETPEPTATSTEIPIEWKFELSHGVDCVQPWHRIHNQNQVTVIVTGQIFANDTLISEVPVPYQSCLPDGWCGPEGDINQNEFVGIISGWVKAEYQGEKVFYNSFSEQLDCRPETPSPTASPTITNTPNTPTGTYQPPSPTATATEMSGVQNIQMSVGGGASDERILMPGRCFGSVLFGLAPVFVVVVIVKRKSIFK